MQEDLKMELEKRGMEIKPWGEKILGVKDGDRAIAIAFIDNFSEVDIINNEVMEKLYSVQNREDDTIKLCEEYLMQKILWDVYIIFVLTNEKKFVDIEQVFMLQRDKKYSKKYLIQEVNIKDIANKIVKLLYPQYYIDKVMNKIQYEISDEDICKKICDAENRGKKYVEEFDIKICQDIVDFLNEINRDMDMERI